MRMEITRVVVMINGPGTDEVFLYTELPSPVPGVTSQPMAARFSAEHGKGVEYALTHFDEVPIEVMDANTGKRQRVQWYPSEGPGCWYSEPIKEKP
jgi:hypothetical protein